MAFFVQGVLSITNLLLSLFVLVFAIFFLRKTISVKDRNPWVFLFVAVVVFFILQIINVMALVGILDFTNYTYYFDSMFIAILLFTFVFQYNLILNSELILIAKKSEPVGIWLPKGSIKHTKAEVLKRRKN